MLSFCLVLRQSSRVCQASYVCIYLFVFRSSVSSCMPARGVFGLPYERVDVVCFAQKAGEVGCECVFATRCPPDAQEVGSWCA